MSPSTRGEPNPGKDSYDRACATCHGTDAMGSLGPGLRPFTLTDSELFAIVRGGGAQMMAFTRRDLADAEVASIAAYLRSSSPPAATQSSDAPSSAETRMPDLRTLKVAPALSEVTNEMLAHPDPADWLSWRRTLDGWGYSPLDQIAKGNVRSLQLAWSWALEPGPSQTTPLVHDGVLYIANPGNVVDAVDAQTGDLLWEFRWPMEERRRPSAQTRSLATYGGAIFLATVDAHLVALDGRTGEVRWDTPVGGDGSAGFTFTSGPIVADGAVVAGLTGCSRFDDETCYVVALDGRTGSPIWRTSTIALPGEPGGDTWGDLPAKFRAGGDAWMPGSYDPVAKVIYWGTAQAKPWARSVRGTDADALYTNSTLALDPRTGRILWFFQHLPGESFDMDEAFERILIDHDGKSSVFTMGKLGILWELERASGAFVRATDTGYQTLVDIDARTGRATYREGMVQSVGKEISFCPSTGGFKSLRAMAYHPATRALYVPLHLTCETAVFEGMEREEGRGGAGPVTVVDYQFHPKSPDAIGELQALEVSTGNLLWSQRRRAPYTTATLTTGGGLVFVGTWDRLVLAYDAATGTLLWQSRLPTLANGFPITYAVKGRQYLAISAGASIQSSSWVVRIPRELLRDDRTPRAGNALFVFALPEGEQ